MAGKTPVMCAPSAGYIVPRIQALAMNEAARMVEEGVASAEDIDTAVRLGFGLRFSVLGLLEFIDWGGGDILYYASRYLAGALDPLRGAGCDHAQHGTGPQRLARRPGLLRLRRRGRGRVSDAAAGAAARPAGAAGPAAALRLGAERGRRGAAPAA